ncbi:response regulator transcription factor [Serratia ficaria]|uniref:Capsular synthesis regulator component B n=1 Tax=Serratia ficaria TaxID=61651 RepID=A0A240CA34_SERFI|nr:MULTISPECIES: response regulator transcription factor [Serratia]MEE4484854.1 response regulator transcription factor [Serratia ficaria]REF43296.1 two-component system capsular synthesis response regulator RcsB [Serratia ficaria]CAI0700723.1 Capsular synthesis regulator component B [Serratia ficaria]CAI1063367.1 Capsular synthesis regulator component B [Serratia ficaria]CAI1111114.1 Capsular synthesis regulator component B [Serratia ficaria]
MNINDQHGTITDSVPVYEKKNRTAIIMEPCPITALGINNRLVESCGYRRDGIQQAGSLAELRLALAKYQPQLLIMELCGKSESVLDGLRLIAEVQAGSPHTALLVCTALDEPRVLRQLIASGIRGLMLKQEPAIALVHCVQQVLTGKRSFSHRIRQRHLHDAAASKPLTARELDVLTQLFSGKSVTNVALTLCRDIRTVSTHKRNAMLKLGFRNDGELYLQGKWMAMNGPSFVR